MFQQIMQEDFFFFGGAALLDAVAVAVVVAVVDSDDDSGFAIDSLCTGLSPSAVSCNHKTNVLLRRIIFKT